MSATYKLVIHFRPFFNPTADFDWEPRFFRWYWLAWLYGAWMIATADAATCATIYRRDRAFGATTRTGRTT